MINQLINYSYGFITTIIFVILKRICILTIKNVHHRTKQAWKLFGEGNFWP